MLPEQRLEATGIEVQDSTNVNLYFAQHPEMLHITLAVYETAKSMFSVSTRFSLMVYVDPEINDRYLTLYVRQQSYDSNILDQIEQISERLHELAKGVSGRLLITTDFQPVEP